MDLKTFAMDHMGHFSVSDLPGVLFAVLLAALLGTVLAMVDARQERAQALELGLWSATAALAVTFAGFQLPLAVALLAISLIVRIEVGSGRERVLRFGALVLGLGCGGGAALVTAMVFIPYLLLVRWVFRAEARA